MPKSANFKSILVIGAGPIVIGQACEFDYAGTQACLALREEGYRVILVNSNPATIMTDPEYSDSTYIEPLTVSSLEKIIAKERPCALLATMGGQTALNLAMELDKTGILARYKVSLIGASVEAIRRAEDRHIFRKTMQHIGLDLPKSVTARSFEEALKHVGNIGFPVMIRPSFTLGGSGCGIAHDKNEFDSICKRAFAIGSHQEITLDEALIGWKEFEMEVIRDKKNNCIVVCSIENFDALGVHTGDSITVAPALTLTDKEYQKMRSSSFAVLNAIGVETGGANVQFAVHPQTGRQVVIEMNPRVSRSSALASKATGFPIAKIAAKLAVGYTLDELSCDITGNQIPASFEPVLDYIVVKIPRHQFEKFPDAKDELGPQMFSVGEAMGIGRSFSEALLKAMRSMETKEEGEWNDIEVLKTASSKRIHQIFSAFKKGISVDTVHQWTHIDPWFLEEIRKITEAEKSAQWNAESFLEMKCIGFSDKQLANIFQCSEWKIRKQRTEWDIKPAFKRIDTCAGEFSTPTSYAYSTYEPFCEIKNSLFEKILILGSGVNRIGQGIEFDYSCVHAVKAFKKLGYETIMVNCNPETVSTDYDCADRLYFGPLTLEDVLAIIDKEKPIGVCCQFGGQTPLNLAKELELNGVKLLGLDMRVVELSEDRAQFREVLNALGLKQPENFIFNEYAKDLTQCAFPVIARPSFVIGGRGMEILENEDDLLKYWSEFKKHSAENLLIERYLSNAMEIDVDAISDGHEIYIPYIMEQIESAGVHSGDSASYFPSLRLSVNQQKKLYEQTKALAVHLNIKGLLNIQFAIQDEDIYILELNPRASRSLPFLSKATGVDLVSLAVQCMMGFALKDLSFPKTLKTDFTFVKESVFSSSKLNTGTLGPEMKSTGEVMGLGKTFSEAYEKAQLAAGYSLNSKFKHNVYSLQEVYNA